MRVNFKFGTMYLHNNDGERDQGYVADCSVVKDDPRFTSLYATVTVVLRVDKSIADPLYEALFDDEVGMEVSAAKPSKHQPVLERSIKV